MGLDPVSFLYGYSPGRCLDKPSSAILALPALGIAGLGARDIMGFCVVDLILSGIIVCVTFVVVGLI